MTCKDCIHYEVCATKEEKISLATKVKELVADNFTCFKNKADFVEVVRCKDCKYGELDDPALPNQRFCRHNGCDWNNENHFCSYGERKKNNKEG